MGELVQKNSKRTAIRRALKLTCEVAREHDGVFVARHGLDVSQDGMRVLSEADVAPGELLVVSFKATDVGLTFRTTARVARVLSGRRVGEAGRSLGLSFESLGAVSRLILRGNFRRIPPPIPRRPQPIEYAASLAQLLSRPAA